jgi:hypothetical protein
MGGPARTTSWTMPTNRSPSTIGDNGSSSASMIISRPLLSRACRANHDTGRGQDRRHDALRNYPIN